jgi:hypothetical protein
MKKILYSIFVLMTHTLEAQQAFWHFNTNHISYGVVYEKSRDTFNVQTYALIQGTFFNEEGQDLLAPK